MASRRTPPSAAPARPLLEAHRYLRRGPVNERAGASWWPRTATGSAAGFALLAVLARPVGGWLSDRIGAERVLRICFVATIALAAGRAGADRLIVPLTICCLAVAGVVGAAGGLGGFFPPLVMALLRSLTGGYTLGFILLAAVAVGCLVVLLRFDPARPGPSRGVRVGRAAPSPQ